MQETWAMAPAPGVGEAGVTREGGHAGPQRPLTPPHGLEPAVSQSVSPQTPQRAGSVLARVANTERKRGKRKGGERGGRVGRSGKDRGTRGGREGRGERGSGGQGKGQAGEQGWRRQGLLSSKGSVPPPRPHPSGLELGLQPRPRTKRVDGHPAGELRGLPVEHGAQRVRGREADHHVAHEVDAQRAGDVGLRRKQRQASPHPAALLAHAWEQGAMASTPWSFRPCHSRSCPSLHWAVGVWTSRRIRHLFP